MNRYGWFLTVLNKILYHVWKNDFFDGDKVLEQLEAFDESTNVFSISSDLLIISGSKELDEHFPQMEWETWTGGEGGREGGGGGGRSGSSLASNWVKVLCICSAVSSKRSSCLQNSFSDIKFSR